MAWRRLHSIIDRCLPESVNGQAPISLIRSLPYDRREAIAIAYVPAVRVRRNLRALCFPAESVRVVNVDATWGVLKNGCGTPPVRTDAGWLSVYHGVDARTHVDGRETLFYRAGLLVHDIERPHVLRYRSPEPFLGPVTREERVGVVDDVVFPTGIDSAPRWFRPLLRCGRRKVSRARLNVALDISRRESA